MKQNGRVNSLLVELLIVVLFFMLASTTMMQIFGAAKQYSNRAGASTEAMMQAQNMAEVLYAASSAQDKLTEWGFVLTDGQWRKDCGSYVMIAECEEEATAAGVLLKTAFSPQYQGETLFTLPVVRYVGGEVQP